MTPYIWRKRDGESRQFNSSEISIDAQILAAGSVNIDIRAEKATKMETAYENKTRRDFEFTFHRKEFVFVNFVGLFDDLARFHAKPGNTGK